MGRSTSLVRQVSPDRRNRLTISAASGALPADRDKGHQARFRQWVTPAMARSVLHDAIALTQMDLLPVVQLQCHLAANHDAIVDGVRSVHPRRAALEMVS